MRDLYQKALVKILLSMYCGCMSTVCFAQDQREGTMGSWLIINGSNRVTAAMDIDLEIRWQHYGVLEDFDNAFVRMGLSYEFYPKITVSAGYGHQYTEALDAQTNSENRLYEEVTVKGYLKKVRLVHRFRIEHRWVNFEGETQTSHRLRYRFQLTHEISKNLYIKAFDEFFITMKSPSFTQNRLHFGLGYQLSDIIQLEIGYVKNHFKEIDYDRIRLGVNFKDIFMGSPKTP